MQLDSGTLTVAGNLSVPNFDMLGGDLQANAGLTVTGTADIAGQVQLSGSSTVLAITGTATLEDQTAITGDGLLQLNGGTLAVNGTVGVQNFDVVSGTLQGGGTLNLSGTMNWLAGSFTAAGTLNVGADAVLNINPTDSVTLTGWTINVDGIVNWLQGDVQNSDSTLTVNADGTLNISSSGTWADAAGDGLSVINNAGTTNITDANGAAATIDAAFTDTGTTNDDSGNLVLCDGGAVGGTFDIGAASDTVLENGDFIAEQPNFGPSQTTGQIGRPLLARPSG